MKIRLGLMLLISTAACGKIASEEVPPPGVAPAEAPPVVAAPVAPSAPSAPATSPKPAPTGTGVITLAQDIRTSPVDGKVSMGFAASAYWVADAAPLDPRCALSRIAGCEITECTRAGAHFGYPAGNANAGVLTITGGTLTPGGLSFTQRPDGDGYATIYHDARGYNSGEQLFVSSTGNAVPAFAKQGATGPEDDLTITSPLFEPIHLVPGHKIMTVEGGGTVVNTVDLPVAWTGAPAAMIEIELQTTSQTAYQNGHAVSVRCVAPGAGGAATVPAEALARLDKADKVSTWGTLSIRPFTETTFRAGGFVNVLRVLGTNKGGWFVNGP